MDHLPLPRSATIRNLQIPFLSSQPYDGGPLINYPQRNGWKIEYILNDKQCTVSHQEPSIVTGNVASLVQTWLYFGLLCEFLGKPVDSTLFQSSGRGKQTLLSTNSLERLVCDHVVRLRDEHRSEPHQSSLDSWKQQTYNAILEARHNSLMISYTQNETPESDLALICLAIAALGEYLSFAIGDLYLHLGLESPVQQTWRLITDIHADCGQAIQSRMIKLGWCPSTLARLNLTHARDVSSLWYFANLAPPRAGQSHESCSAEQCTYLQLNKERYEIVDATPQCECSQIGPDQVRLEEIVRKGGLPIVTVKNNAAEEVSVVIIEEFSPGKSFVAISHVWADGRGNPGGNSLPICTLHELQDLVNSLPGALASTATPFWIDTLCVPRKDKSLRKEAIKRLRQPYDLASHVLVLDAYLKSQDSHEIDMTESLALITVSTWTQRLWTFSEGRLATRAWFAFRDRCIEPRASVKQWHETFGRMPPLASHNVAISMIVNHTSTTVSPEMDNQYSSGIVMLRSALRTRSTSVASDEAWCLGNILGLNIDAIVEGPADRRMQVLWSLVPAIPKGLVFSRTRRKLEGKGFRWAPASLMGELDEVLWEGPNGINSMFDTTCTSSGLEFKQAAWIFGPQDDQSMSQGSKEYLLRKFDIVQTPIPDDDLGLELFHIRDAAGRWFSVTLDQAWHQHPKTVNLTHMPILLIDRPQEFGDRTMRRPSSDFSGQGNNLALLATCSSIPSTHSFMQVTVHRHASVSMLSRKSQQRAELTMQYYHRLLASHDQEIRQMGGDEEGMQKLVRDVIEPTLHETDVLELMREIRASKRQRTDEESVITACVFLIARLCLLGPWCMVRDVDEDVTWCVD